MSEDEIEGIRKDMGTAGTVAGVAGMATDVAMGGAAGATADAILAGGTTVAGAEITGAAAFGAGAFAAAGVVGAAALGYEVGSMIDQATGASDSISSAAVAADPSLARSAANDWDDAGAAWDRADHLEAIGEGAEAVGKFAVGTAEAAADAVGHAVTDAVDAVRDLF